MTRDEFAKLETQASITTHDGWSFAILRRNTRMDTLEIQFTWFSGSNHALTGWEETVTVPYLQSEDDSAEITLYINSPGGELASGLALYDVMTALRCPVRTVCMGTAASMAALIFAAGSRREMLPHARLMIHDPLIAGGVGGSALHIDSVSRDLMRTREITAALLARHSGHTLAEVYEKTAKDTYFDADEAVAWGLADRITHEI